MVLLSNCSWSRWGITEVKNVGHMEEGLQNDRALPCGNGGAGASNSDWKDQESSEEVKLENYNLLKLGEPLLLMLIKGDNSCFSKVPLTPKLFGVVQLSLLYEDGFLS